jgi:hypothetical protein
MQVDSSSQETPRQRWAIVDNIMTMLAIMTIRIPAKVSNRRPSRTSSSKNKKIVKEVNTSAGTFAAPAESGCVADVVTSNVSIGLIERSRM